MTAFFCVIFVLVEQSWAVRASTVGISLSATVGSSRLVAQATCSRGVYFQAMWAVLYGWTPEIFGTKGEAGPSPLDEGHAYS